MKWTYQYNTDVEKQAIMDSNTDKILIEEQNIVDGKFLIFSDEESLPTEERLSRLETKVDLILAKQEALV